jgi:hypothetical protein
MDPESVLVEPKSTVYKCFELLISPTHCTVKTNMTAVLKEILYKSNYALYNIIIL